ncbi:MAG: hypothetical protein KCHDKBKB_00508 [Elusimicrobia bacterium]|nr:hypothetical protein [Elusimicrobiota bacterium]
MALFLLGLTGSLMAEGPTVSGYVDTQYGYNFSKPNTGTTALRSYDSQDNTLANTVHLSFAGTFGEGIGYVVDLDAGHDANTTVGSIPASGVALQEGYLTYMAPCKLGFKVGKFATYEGIEVIETNANPTISRGYLYGLAEPYTHVGGVATFVLGKLDFAAGLVNGWDQANDNNQGKTVIGKIGLSLGDPLMATLSGTHGPEQNQVTSGGVITDSRSGANRDSIDLTVLTKIIPMVDLYLQANAGTEAQVVDNDGDTINDDRASWSGAGVQPIIHFGDKFSIGARLEYFSDPEGARTGTRNISTTNITITPGYKITDNVLVRAEYRQDSSNKKIWVDDKGMLEDSVSTGALQFLVTF